MPTSRTANGRWKRFRQSVIRNAGTNPACHWCGGMLNPRAARGEMGAIEVDHIVPYVQRPDLEFDRGNVVLSCHPCNRSKGQRDAPGMPDSTPPPRTFVTSRRW